MKNTTETETRTQAVTIRNLRRGQRFDYAGERVEVIGVGRYCSQTGTCMVMTVDHGALWISGNRMVRTYRKAATR